MGRRHFQRPACWQLFIRIGHHKAARIKLAGCLADIFPVFGKAAIAGNIHTIDICLCLAIYHPFGQRFADPAPLQETRHHRTGTPIARLARHGPYQRVAIR